MVLKHFRYEIYFICNYEDADDKWLINPHFCKAKLEYYMPSYLKVETILYNTREKENKENSTEQFRFCNMKV